MNPETVQVILRHGIASPVTVELQQAELLHLSQLSVEAGIDYLLTKIPDTQGFTTAFRETLSDPYSIIELRQGDLVRVVSRRRPPEKEIVPQKVFTKPVQTLEIGVSKAQAGG